MVGGEEKVHSRELGASFLGSCSDSIEIETSVESGPGYWLLRERLLLSCLGALA